MTPTFNTGQRIRRLLLAIPMIVMVVTCSPTLVSAGGNASDSSTVTVYTSTSVCDKTATAGTQQANAAINSDTLANGGFSASQKPGMPYSDTSTLARVCQDLLPGSQVMNYSVHHYASPGDNYVYAWTGTTWQLHGASWSNNGIHTISCVIPTACSAPIPPVCTCPTDYTLQGSSCVLSNNKNPQCPVGLVLLNGQCYVPGVVCPADYTPVAGGCLGPDGIAYLFANGGQNTNNSCEAATTCVGNNFFQRSSSCQVYSQACTYGCTAGACRVGGTLTASPQLVRPGDSVSLTWSLIEQPGVPAAPVNLCQVVGDNGDQWTGKSGTASSSAITNQTQFTLSCDGITLDSATVQVIPTWQEN